MRRLVSFGSLLAIIVSLLASAAPAQSASLTSHSPRMQVSAATSHNWSGYVAETDFTTPESYAVTDVKGQWIVPQVAPSAGKSYSAVWVGMDGYGSVTHTTVEQIGTEEDYINGTPQYYAWYEFYPAASHAINYILKPGDSMSGEVQYDNGQFTLTLTDATQGWTFTTTHQLNKAARNSAEWIVEAPGNIILPLADFGTVTFTGCSATFDGATGPISDRGWQYTPIDMVDFNGVLRARTLALGHGGDSFNVTFLPGN
jgi:hypothetical protein